MDLNYHDIIMLRTFRGYEEAKQILLTNLKKEFENSSFDFEERDQSLTFHAPLFTTRNDFDHTRRYILVGSGALKFKKTPEGVEVAVWIDWKARVFTLTAILSVFMLIFLFLARPAFLFQSYKGWFLLFLPVVFLSLGHLVSYAYAKYFCSKLRQMEAILK